MKRYDTYKPSGIDWIGEVPEHWEQCRFKNFIQLITKPSISLVKIGLENIESGSGCFIQTDSEFEGSGVEFLKNDVVYGKLRPYLQKVWLASFDGNAVGDFFVFRVKSNSNATYLKYLLLSDGFTREADGATFGAKMPRVSSDFIMTLRYFLPPLAEQEAIAAYLDARCADIDKVVATQQKRIALLQELKQSEITQAVMRGLNPDARMKDSGVEWIGMVPEHWEVIPFKSKFKTDKGLSITKADLVDEGVPVISYGQIHSKQNDYVHTLDHLLRFIPEEMAPADSKAKLEIGDIVFADTSEDVEGSGNAFYIDREGIYAGYHTVIAKSIERVDNKYFAYLFATPVWRSQVRSQVYGVKVFSITQQILKSTSLIAPPVEERKQIVEVLEEKCARIDKQIEKIQNQIELLREYKQAIITEAVTGKIKVS